MSGVHEGMAAVMTAVSYIAKESSTGVNYQFRSIDAVMNALHGPLADAGLFLSPRVLDDWQLNPIPGSPDNRGNPRTQFQASFRICVDVYAADGSMVTLGPGLAQSHDYGDKAVYQAQQNAIKYLLLEAFAIPTAEMDMDAREADDAVHVQESEVQVNPDVQWKRWVWDESAVFKAWSENERKTEAKLAMERLGVTELLTQPEAQHVLDDMRAVYESRPKQDDALPLEES